MKSRTTWFLLVVTLAVAAVVVWDVKKGTPTDQARQQRKRIVELKARDVTGLELIRTNQTITLAKTGDRWAITKPHAVRANAGAVNTLLDELELTERQRLLTVKDLVGTKPADFGLDQPWLKLTVQRPAGPLTVLVGKETPTKDAHYVQIAGQPDLHVVQKSTATRLDRSLDDLRDRTVVEFTTAAATRLQIKNRERSIELAKTQNRWALSQPLAARADAQRVSELLDTLQGLRVAEFVSEEAGAVHAFGLDEPVTEVTVWTGETGQTLLIGPARTNDATKVFAKLKSADSIFTVPADAAQKFVVQINDVRDKQVLPVTAAAVRGVQIVAAGRELALARTDSVWQVTAPQAMPAESASVDRLLDRLTGLTAQQFVADVPTDLDKFGLAAPGWTVSLQGEGTNVLAQLLIGGLEASNGWRYVKRADEPFVYGVESNLIAALPATPLAVRARQLVDLKADEIKKLAIQQGSAQIVVERDAAGQWQLVEPAAGALDAAAADQLAEAVAQLRAEEYWETTPADAGLAAPVAKITATAGATTVVVSVGKSAGDAKHYAALADPALTFTLAEFTAKTLTSPLLTPPATNAPPAAAPAP